MASVSIVTQRRLAQLIGIIFNLRSTCPECLRPTYMTTVPQHHSGQTHGQRDNIRWHYPCHFYCMHGASTPSATL